MNEILISALLASVATVSAANAETIALSYTGDKGDFSINAILNASEFAPGQWLISSLTGLVTSPFGVESMMLIPGGPDTFQTSGSSAGSFDIDNVIYPTAATVLDIDGIGFTASGAEWNVWGNDPGSPSPYTLYTFEDDRSTQDFGTVTIAVIPEPSTWAMLLGGFAGLGFVAFRTRRSPVSMA